MNYTYVNFQQNVVIKIRNFVHPRRVALNFTLDEPFKFEKRGPAHDVLDGSFESDRLCFATINYFYVSTLSRGLNERSQNSSVPELTVACGLPD